MSDIRWTDKVYLDNQGNLQYSNNVDQSTQDTIYKMMVNTDWVNNIEDKENKE